MTIYQVLPRLWKNGKFSDWNDDSFNYLKSLSVDCVWYTGIIRHACGTPWTKGDLGSPYAISDYFDVNPYLADNEDNRMEEFESLVARTHEAGFKVLIDLVPNHVARGGASGIPVHDWCDYDWTDTSKIDYSHPDSWGKMLEVVRFWARKGIDGMRCDMVELVPRDFLARLISETGREFPGFIFIGEVYSKENYRSFVRDAGFDLLYDKSGLYDRLRGIVCQGWSVREITRNWQELGDLQGSMLNFLENHDEQRFANPHFAACPSKAWAALAVAALFNGASFMLYFGQECGESAPESDNGRTSIFSKTVVSSLEHPDKQVFAKYKSILKLAASPLFRKGRNFDLNYCNEDSEGFDPDRHFAFLRILGKKAALVLCNFSSEEVTAGVKIPQESGLKESVCIVKAKPWDFSKINLSL